MSLPRRERIGHQVDMAEGIGFVAYLYDTVLPYLVREAALSVASLGPLRLLLALVVFLGVLKALEIVLWLLRKLWLPVAALVTVGALALAMGQS